MFKKFNFTSLWLNYLLVALLCLPLFLINIKDSHTWGGNFAQYIHQAKNIVEGIPQSETGFIFNKNYSAMGPSVYPIGFPLLLSPVYYLFGNSIKPFLVLISFFLFILALALLKYYRMYFTPLISTILVLTIVYNPWTLDFKSNILSDIPFTFFLILAVCIFLRSDQNKLLNIFITGILIGTLISIRTIGIVFIFAMLCTFVKDLIKIKKTNKSKNDLKRLIKNTTLTLVITFGFYILTKLLFPLPTEGTYFDQITLKDIFNRFFLNLSHYSVLLQNFFHPTGTYNRYNFLGIILSSLAISCMVVGIIHKFSKNISFIDFLVIGYIGILLLWPATQMFRFLLPIFPFLLQYMVTGLTRIKINNKLNKKVTTLILTGVILALYYHRVLHIIKKQDEIVKGPQEIKSIEAFEYIKENTAKNSVIAFIKPRVLALYTERQSMANSHNEVDILEKEFSQYNVNYLLVHNEISDSTLTNYVKSNKNKVGLLWENEVYYLYKR